MEALQQKLCNIIEYHTKQQNTRLPDLRSRLDEINSQLILVNEQVQKRLLPFYETKPKKARLEAHKKVLEEEIHKLSDTELFHVFQTKIKRQIGNMIIDDSFDSVEPDTKKQRTTLDKPKSMMSELGQIVDQVWSIDAEQEIIDDLSNQDEPILEEQTPKESQERAFLMHFAEINLPVQHDTKPIRSSELSLAIREQQQREQQTVLSQRKQKHFCSKCNSPMFSAPNEARSICRCSRMVEQNNTIAYTHSFEQDGNVKTGPIKSQQVLKVLEVFRPRKPIEVPAIVFERLKAFERQNRYKRTRELNIGQLDDYLKHLGYTDLQNDKYHIASMLYGRKWPELTELQEKKIAFVFGEMQRAFTSVKQRLTLYREAQSSVGINMEDCDEVDNPEEKSSVSTMTDGATHKEIQFPRCDLVVYHICRMLNYHEFLPFIKQLAIPSKRMKQLEMIELLCQELNIDYQPLINDEL